MVYVHVISEEIKILWELLPLTLALLVRGQDQTQ